MTPGALVMPATPDLLGSMEFRVDRTPLPVGRFNDVPYDRMNDDEVRAFLTSMPPHTGKVATVRADGRPHVAPVGFAVDDDGSIYFTTGADTVKGKNLARSGYAAMSVDDERPPFSFVMLEGPVELSDDLDAVRQWATVVGGRYMGDDKAEAFGAATPCPASCWRTCAPRR